MALWISWVSGTYVFFSMSKKYRGSLIWARLNPSSTSRTFFILNVPVISRQGCKAQKGNLLIIFMNKQKTKSDFLLFHLNPDESRSCVRWEVADDLLVGVQTIEILSFIQNKRCHANPPFVAWAILVRSALIQTQNAAELQVFFGSCSSVSPSTLTP